MHYKFKKIILWIYLLSFNSPTAYADGLSLQLKKDINAISKSGQVKQNTKELENWLKHKKSRQIIVDETKINQPIANANGVNIDALLHKYKSF